MECRVSRGGEPASKPFSHATPHCSAVLFDLDGTLIDSVELIVRSFLHATAVHLGASPPRAAILATIGRPLEPVLEGLAPGRGALLLATYRAYTREHHDALVRPFPGAVELLRALWERGYRLGIVTSKSRPQAELAFRLCALEPLVDVTVCAEDAPRLKPAADPLLLAASRLAVAPMNCLYVGDTVHDLGAARAAEMASAAVLWGAGACEELAALSPDLWLTEPLALLDHCPPR